MKTFPKDWKTRLEAIKQEEREFQAREKYWERIFAQASETQQTKEQKLSESS